MQLFESKDAATMERNLLRVYEIVYPRAVEMVATALRERFEAGELRGWMDEDTERCSADVVAGRSRGYNPPFWRIEDECRRRFVTTPVRALGVIESSPNTKTASAHGWDFNDPQPEPLRHVAASAMAFDVLHLARTKGWSKPLKGEEPAFKPARKAARKAVRS
jgi:hypothetical protein